MSETPAGGCRDVSPVRQRTGENGAWRVLDPGGGGIGPAAWCCPSCTTTAVITRSTPELKVKVTGGSLGQRQIPASTAATPQSVWPTRASARPVRTGAPRLRRRGEILSTLRSWRSTEKAPAMRSGGSTARTSGRPPWRRGNRRLLPRRAWRYPAPARRPSRAACRRPPGPATGAGEHQPAGQFQVAAHALGVDQEGVHQARGFGQQVVGEDGGIGQDHAFHRGMRDVALVPQRDVLEGRLHVCADHPRQAANLFAGDRIALVRHGGAALLPARKILFGLAHFGALQMAHLQGDFSHSAVASASAATK